MTSYEDFQFETERLDVIRLRVRFNSDQIQLKYVFKVSILIIFVYCCKYDMYDFTFLRWQILPAEPLSTIAHRFTRIE